MCRPCRVRGAVVGVVVVVLLESRVLGLELLERVQLGVAGGARGRRRRELQDPHRRGRRDRQLLLVISREVVIYTRRGRR